MEILIIAASILLLTTLRKHQRKPHLSPLVRVLPSPCKELKKLDDKHLLDRIKKEVKNAGYKELEIQKGFNSIKFENEIYYAHNILEGFDSINNSKEQAKAHLIEGLIEHMERTSSEYFFISQVNYLVCEKGWHVYRISFGTNKDN